jgi:Pentapeptide repeats (8 copies)
MAKAYSPRVMAAVQAMSERHFGSWQLVPRRSFIDLQPRTMGFVSGPALRICFDVGDEILANLGEPELLVSDRPETVEKASELWPHVRAMRMADFIDFVAPPARTRVAPNGGSTNPGLERLPTIRLDGTDIPIVEYCAAKVMGLNGEAAKPTLILGGARSGKTTILDKIGYHVWEVAGFERVKVCLPGQGHDVSNDALLRASIGARLQLADHHLAELAPYLSSALLIVVDDAHLNAEGFKKAVQHAEGYGMRIVASADHRSSADFPAEWNRLEIGCVSPHEVASLIMEVMGRKRARTYYPTLRLSRCVASVEEARDLEAALPKGSDDIDAAADLAEWRVAASLLDQAADRIVRRIQPLATQADDTSDLRAKMNELIGCHALESTLRGKLGLRRAECAFLSTKNVLRLVDHPRHTDSSAMQVLEAASFLQRHVPGETAHRDMTWRSDLMRAAALGRFVAAELGSEGVIDLRWPTHVSMPHSLVDQLGGMNLICPLLGAVRFDDELLEIIAGALAEMDAPAQARAEERLLKIVSNSRESAFYSVWPWRYAGGNALGLLALLRGRQLTGDFSACRLAGAMLRGINLSGAQFQGSCLADANLCDSQVERDCLERTYLGGAELDEPLRLEMEMNPRFPVLGIGAGKNDIPDWLSAPEGASIQMSSLGGPPLAIANPTTKAEFLSFTRRDPDYGKDAYIERCHTARPEEFDRYYLWDWSEKSEPARGELNDPVVYIGRDAAIAFASDRGGRLFTRAEWLTWAAKDHPPCHFSEWVWDDPSIAFSSEPAWAAERREAEPWPPSFLARPTDGWLGLVGCCDGGDPTTGRIKSTNANDDVTFRTVFDFVHLARSAP